MTELELVRRRRRHEMEVGIRGAIAYRYICEVSD